MGSLPKYQGFSSASVTKLWRLACFWGECKVLVVEGMLHRQDAEGGLGSLASRLAKQPLSLMWATPTDRADLSEI